MRNMKRFLISTICFLISTSVIASPEGMWKTIDDETGKAKALVRISINQHNELEGRIVEIFHEPGSIHETTCVACTGDKKDQPLIGLVFMDQLKQVKGDLNHWEKGTILDPKTGKTYHCQLELSDDQRTMKVRGFVGFSLLGRTQVWERVPSGTV